MCVVLIVTRNIVNRVVVKNDFNGFMILHAEWLGDRAKFVFSPNLIQAFRDQVPEETSPYLLLGAQDQRLGAEQDQLPCGST